MYTADRGGVILSWDLRTGQPLRCFADAKARHAALVAPKIQVWLAWCNLLVEFAQLCTFTFSLNLLDWGAVSAKYSPFDWSSSALQLNVTVDTGRVALVWLLSLFVVWLFVALFAGSYKLKYATSTAGRAAQRALSMLTWACTTIAFIPLLRVLLRTFTCNAQDLANLLLVPSCGDALHILYMALTAATLVVYVPLCYRFAFLEGAIELCDVYSWRRWGGDQPDTRRVHSCSQRSHDLAPVEKTVKVVMVAASVFLVSGLPESAKNSLV